MKDEYVSVEHLLLALAELKDGAVADALRAAGLTREKLLEALGGRARQPARDEPDSRRRPTRRSRSTGATSPRSPQQGKLDPVIGRDEEIRRVIQVLSRRTKNNPVLIGEPGVGKTAIVEGLAQRIVRGDVPEGLKDKRIIALDMGALDRRRQVPRRVRGAAEGGAEGGAGRRGRDHPLHRRAAHRRRRRRGRRRDGREQPAEADARARRAALHRRHDARRVPQAHREGRGARAPLPAGLVDQPTVEDTISILRGLRERYEVHHGVRIKDAALVAAAVLSDRYITDRFLPDKAIDLVDEAAAQAAHRDRLDARRARRGLAARHAARDRARGPAEGDRRRVARPPREAREGAGRPAGAERERLRAQWEARRAAHRAAAPAARSRSSRPSVEIEQGRARLRPQQGRRAAVRQARRARARAQGARRRARRERRASARLAQGRGRRGGHRRGRRALDRHSGLEAAWRASRRSCCSLEEHLHQRVIGQDEAVRGGRRRGHPRPRGPQGSQSPDRLVHLPRARPASARPSWRARSPSSCSTTRQR